MYFLTCGLHNFQLCTLVYLLLGRGVMIGVRWGGKKKALEPLDWLGLDGMDFTTQFFGFL